MGVGTEGEGGRSSVEVREHEGKGRGEGVVGKASCIIRKLKSCPEAAYPSMKQET